MDARAAHFRAQFDKANAEKVKAAKDAIIK